MLVNEDLSRPVVLDTNALPWEAGATPGVERKILECANADLRHYTALVRFAPNTPFPFHYHPHGEEVYVLEGELSDEVGRYPAGTYVRFPVGSDHAPFSGPGCLLLVKLGQMLAADDTDKATDGNTLPWEPMGIAGVESRALYTHTDNIERVSLTRLAPGISAAHMTFEGGEDILVLEGTLEDENGSHPQGTWLRFPPGGGHTPRSTQGCTLLVKHGHMHKG